MASTKTSQAWATIPIPKPRLILPGSASETRIFEQISLQERPRPRHSDWPDRGRRRQALRSQGPRLVLCPAVTAKSKSQVEKLTQRMGAC